LRKINVGTKTLGTILMNAFSKKSVFQRKKEDNLPKYGELM